MKFIRAITLVFGFIIIPIGGGLLEGNDCYRWRFVKICKTQIYIVCDKYQMSESFQSAWTTSAKSRQNLPRNVGVAKKHSCDVMTPWSHNSHGKHTKTTVGSDFKVSKQFLVLQMLYIGFYIMRVPCIYWGLTKVCNAWAADKYNGCLCSTNRQQQVVDFDNWNASILKWPIMCNKCAKQFRLRDCVLKTWYIFILATANIGFHIWAEHVTQILKTLAVN